MAKNPKIASKTRPTARDTHLGMLVLIKCLILLACCLSLLYFKAFGVVVDGDKKDDISPSRHQKSRNDLKLDWSNTDLCGVSDSNPDEHEFVNMAREGQFPWIVSIQIEILKGASYEKQLVAAHSAEPKGPSGNHHDMEDLHICSGAFIKESWILSAAHCFVGPTVENYLKHDKLKVVAGSHKVSSRTSLNRNLTIERVYYHSKFNMSTPVGYDIALIELSKEVRFKTKRDKNEFGEQKGPFMNAICLPANGSHYKFNESARIAGWGLSKAKDIHTMPSKLLFTDLLLSKQDECADKYAERLNSDEPRKRNDYLCASYKTSRDACQSDSGGPLMQYVNRKAVAIGVVSYGIACATEGVPGLYTNTSVYTGWINDITQHGPSARVDFRMIERKKPATGRRSKIIKSIDKDRSTTTTTTSKPVMAL
jgi:hypothetical protein